MRKLEPRSAVTERRTLGYECIDFARDDLGIELHPWQCWLLVHMLELTERGVLRFRTALVLVARQNGKTTVSVVLALFFMYMLGRKLVLGTAQDLDVAEEIWQSALDIVTEGVEDDAPVRPELNDLVESITLTNGKKAFELKTGEKYKVKATNRGAGRSLSADLLLLDELREHQTWAAWAALTKTTMARAFALILCLSNAGNAKSVVLNKLRLVAHLALGNPDGLPSPPLNDDVAELLEEYENDLFIAEWSPPPGCAINDRAAWAFANPSLGSPVATENLVTEKAIANALRTCLAQGPEEEAEFRAEVLCQWPDDDTHAHIDLERWGRLAEPKSQPPARCGWSLDVSPDRLYASIGAAGDRGDGRVLLFLAEETSRYRAALDPDADITEFGTSWVIPKLLEFKRTKGLRRVAVHTRSPAAALIKKIEAAGVEVDAVSDEGLGKACGDLADSVLDGSIVHLGDELVMGALVSAATSPVGDGGWKWRRKGGANITPIVALTLALGASRVARPVIPMAAYA
ncbi:MAG TPA: hypothetical protein VG497_24560 [Kribbella sp.]|nr:hypothetical protein [Kribbella sp.]